VFDRSQILILLNDDLKDDPAGVYARVLRFLEVDASFQPGPRTQYGIGGQPRSRWLYRLATSPSFAKDLLKRVVPARVQARLVSRLVLSKPELGRELRRELARSYLHEISRLEDLIDRDLSHWKPGAG
jgi:hypothetical protein